MAAKTRPSKKIAALPPGLKRSNRQTNPLVRKMVHQDRAVASGGRNTVRRAPALTP